MKLKKETKGESRKIKKRRIEIYEVKVGLRNKESKPLRVKKIERSESCF